MTAPSTSPSPLDPGLRSALATLLGRSGWVHLATVEADGGPQVTPVMLVVRDDALLFSVTGKAKRRNLARDPRACVSIARPEDLAHAVVWGQMTLRTDDEANETWRAMMIEALGDAAFRYAERLSPDGTALGVLTPERWRVYGL